MSSVQFGQPLGLSFLAWLAHPPAKRACRRRPRRRPRRCGLRPNPHAPCSHRPPVSSLCITSLHAARKDLSLLRTGDVVMQGAAGTLSAHIFTLPPATHARLRHPGALRRPLQASSSPVSRSRPPSPLEALLARAGASPGASRGAPPRVAPRFRRPTGGFAALLFPPPASPSGACAERPASAARRSAPRPGATVAGAHRIPLALCQQRCTLLCLQASAAP